ncbi:hypothetical protein [Brevundimonas sp.]|jgi:hypothetical protein|uniref:hypothetical protein n=1 Tax=Brevundimonas sp. TaxID=1871086 RepID=UPI0037C0251B
MPRVLIFGIVLASLGLAGAPVSAQTADASLTVQRSLSVVTVRPILLASPGRGTTLSLRALVDRDAPAEIQVTGDPGRVYRIRVPRTLVSSDGRALVEDLRIWSVNAGDVSTTRVSHMDLQGRDLLRVTGQLRLEGSEAVLEAVSLPLSIDYE